MAVFSMKIIRLCDLYCCWCHVQFSIVIGVVTNIRIVISTDTACDIYIYYIVYIDVYIGIYIDTDIGNIVSITFGRGIGICIRNYISIGINIVVCFSIDCFIDI